MKYLLFTVGTIGDLNPFLCLGGAMRDRGHDVMLLTNRRHRDSVVDAGLSFVNVDHDDRVENYLNDPDYFNVAKSWKLALQACFLGPMRRTFDIIRQQSLTQPVAVVSSPAGLGARIAHDALGVPLATIQLEPNNLRSVHDTAAMPPLILNEKVPRFIKAAQLWIADRFFSDRHLSSAVNSFRAELGLGPVRRITQHWWNSPKLIIGMFPEWFAPRQPDWPKHFEYAGFALANNAGLEKTPDDIYAFVQKNRPVIFVSGSNDAATKDYFRVAIDVCNQLNCHALLLGPGHATIPQNLEERIRHCKFVPLAQILNDSTAIVHHGGAGTAAQSLAAGIPQLVIPSVHGTEDIARRLQLLGVSSTLRRSVYSNQAVASKLTELVESPSVKQNCRRFQSAMKDTDPISRCCDLLLTIGQ